MTGHRIRSQSPITLGLLALAAIVLSCDNPIGIYGQRPCEQTGEFTNTGCFEVAGQVVGGDGLPLSGITVQPRPLSNVGTDAPPIGLRGFDSNYTITNATGHFSVRLHRMTGGKPASGPDTVSVYVQLRRNGGGSTQPMDSVRTLVTVSPVGEVPVPATLHYKADMHR
jgi:hypothetical protein